MKQVVIGNGQGTLRFLDNPDDPSIAEGAA